MKAIQYEYSIPRLATGRIAGHQHRDIIVLCHAFKGCLLTVQYPIPFFVPKRGWSDKPRLCAEYV